LGLDASYRAFVDPPREFGIIPFWFWNDDLEEAELLRQLRAFYDAGFGGVMPHARVGLSHRVGYLTDEYFRLIRVVVDEAARLGMKVILYDEGSYPSGSANGAVVAENPEYASQSIRLWEKDFEGPHSGYWRPNTGRAFLDKHVCTVKGRVDAEGAIDPDSVEVLEPHENTIFRVDVPDGQCKVMSVWNTASGGTIRGVFEESEDAHATAPAAGDLLNPDAVDCFIRLTHDRYYDVLEEHFGDTVIAMFTDEPNVTGRGARQRGKHHAKPFTPGFVDWLTQLWGEDPTAWLPALWMDYGPETEAFRYRYEEAVQTRLQEVFYGGQSKWCADHGIELTGHPAESNELTALRLFQLPGQDMVWRYIEPNKGTGIEGEHSLAAKAATSGARLSDRRRILTELCGAYGWHLTLDELKWLFDWHLVRGNNLFNPHAVFYSIRERRAWESEPDLMLHNVWGPYFPAIAHYTRRLSWLLTDGEHVCDVAILGDGNQLPWAASKVLYEKQIDFLYLDDRAVSEGAVEDGKLAVGAQRYGVVVVEGLSDLSDGARANLSAFEEAGGRIVYLSGEGLDDGFAEGFPLDLSIDPPNPDLRFTHYRKQGIEHYLLVNEGEDAIEGRVHLSAIGQVEVWDALTESRSRPACSKTGTGVSLDLDLERRTSVVLSVDPSKSVEPPEAEWPIDVERIPIDVDWSVLDSEGNPTSIPGLSDWSREANWELYSGSLTYRAEFDFPEADSVTLDLGAVGDIAEVFLDGESSGVRMWAPYAVSLGKVAPGRHVVEVRVTNSMANAYEGLQMPSGLMGPVHLVARRGQ